jgi:glycosyltransferase involved in cell wall biosynthesis
VNVMKDKDPLVSVIITVFNGEKYLREAIESVIGQTYDSFELIVVDDGSTDNSGKIANGFTPQLRYFYQENCGQGAALNRGIELSRGRFLSFLDDDDLWTKDKLARQMAAFADNPEADIVFGHVEQFYSSELDENYRKSVRIPAKVMPGYFKGSMLIKRDSFSRVGKFDTRWRLGDFIDWYSRAMEEGLKSVILNGVVLLRRIHANNIGIRERESRTEFVRILKASLDRRRRKRDSVGPSNISSDFDVKGALKSTKR